MKYVVINESLINSLENRLGYLNRVIDLMEKDILYEDDSKIEERKLITIIIKELKRVDKKYRMLAKSIEMGGYNNG